MLRKAAVTVTIVNAALLVGCSGGKGGAPTTAKAATETVSPVRVAKAELQTVPVEIATVGNVEAWSTITVKAQIGGTLMKVNFREGEMVKAGDVLFEIDPRPYEQAIKQAEANIARDRAQLAASEANLGRAQAQQAHYTKQADRYERLAKEGIFSREQADQMGVELRSRNSTVKAETAAKASAEAAIQADQVALETAKLNLSYCTIRSPITGRTGNLLVKQGNLVKANDVELVTIHQIQPVYVTFAVPEAHLLTIRQRASAGRLKVAAGIPNQAGPKTTGTVNFLNNAVDRNTGTIQLKGTFPNSDIRLWPGQFVDVVLRLEERPNTVTVPASCVQTGQAGSFVYVVKPDNSVEMRQVRPGPRTGAVIAIDQGLGAGETVVTEGQLRLAPGAKVKVMS